MDKLYYDISNGLLNIDEIKERAKKYKSVRVLEKDNYYVVIFERNSNGNVYLPTIIKK